MGGLTMPKTRILFLMSLVYLTSFASLYIQLPGLFGRNGVLPVDKLPTTSVNAFDDFLANPSLLRLAKFVHLDQFDSLEIVCVLGVLLSLLAVLFEVFRSTSTFFLLWLCHFTCYTAGQTFLHFQWDILLLEVGFLAILLARCDFLFIPLFPKFEASDKIVIFLMKWLLFRLMFASGVVKLTSECPAWWNLQALNHHFETQCLPTPLALWSHSLPEWILKLGVVLTFVIEMYIPILFFIPFKLVRQFCFYSQVILQLAIILTGNYNFFNFLTITLCYSLLTDDDFPKKKPVVLPVASSNKKKGKSSPTPVPVLCKTNSCIFESIPSPLLHLVSLTLIGGVVALSILSFKLEIHGNTITSKIGFTRKEFDQYLTQTVTYSVYAALVSLLLTAYCALRCALRESSYINKLYQAIRVIFIAIIATILVFSSIIVFTQGIAPSVTKLQPQPFHRIHKELLPYQITNSYGLFRRMTTKRNEILLEYSNNANGPWNAIQFHHKPNHAKSMPAIVTPHQPRLDWQMWFAALTTADRQPWIYSLMYRILNGDSEVMQLLNHDSTFKAPKFLRAGIYEFKFTKIDNPYALPTTWWTTKRTGDYVAAQSLPSEFLKEKLTTAGIIGTKNPSLSKPNPVTDALKLARAKIGQPPNLYPLLLVVLVILITKRFLRR